MNCLYDPLALDETAENGTIAVSGCGQRFLYRERCYQNTGECAWVLMSAPHVSEWKTQSHTASSLNHDVAPQ
jgi:hypothetical protein